MQLNQLSFVLQDLGYKEDISKVMRLKEDLEDDRFELIVVGEFSRGKSMFINALLGRRILPSLARPTTAIRNVIVYKERPSIQLYFKDDKRAAETVSEEEFKKIVAPKEAIKGDKESEAIYAREVENLNAINFAEVGYPLQLCKEGVTIIDTPGLNDLDPSRGQITNELIPKADVAIFLLAATKAMSASEMSFLKDRLIANDIQKVFVVINFKDDLDNESDARDVYQKVLTDLHKVLPTEKVYLVSAKQQLYRKLAENGTPATKMGEPVELWEREQTGFVPLEQDIANFLQYERGAVKLGKPIDRARRMIEKVIQEKIRFERESLKQTHEQLQEKVASFQQQLTSIRKMGMEAKKVLNLTLVRERFRIQQWYSDQLSTIKEEGLRTFDQSPSGLSQLSQEVDEAIAPLERELHSRKQKRIEETLQLALDHASLELNEEWEKLEKRYTLAFLGAVEENETIGGNSLTGIEKQGGIVLFDELLDELTFGWREKSMVGKLLSGTGVALTVTFYSILEIGKGLWEMITGESNRKEKLRIQISSQLSRTNEEKVNAFVREWTGLSEAYATQYGEMIERQVAIKETQMERLMYTIRLEGDAIQEKQFLLNRFETKLNDIHRELDMVSEALHVNRRVRV